tara:strand:- start:198 stop:401 length:204 start_codon:yes stop_codon:yes gene_type:complete
MPKKIRAISFDTAREINTLVMVLERSCSRFEENYYTKEQRKQSEKLLSVALEVQQMFFKGEKDAISK